jgi:hypothetical protein
MISSQELFENSGYSTALKRPPFPLRPSGAERDAPSKRTMHRFHNHGKSAGTALERGNLP